MSVVELTQVPQSTALSAGASPGPTAVVHPSDVHSAAPRVSGPSSWSHRIAWLALAAALGAVAARFLLVGGSSLSYDEATYVDLARHPWHSSYYADAFFARHPPLGMLALAPAALVTNNEWILRLPGLVFTGAGVALAWQAARRAGGPQAAALLGILLAGAYPLAVYGIQATMYPVAVFCAGALVWANVAGQHRIERWATIGLALTHLFGFLVLGWWLWRHRKSLRSEVTATALAWVWLAFSALAAPLLNGGLGLQDGPAAQASRIGAILLDPFSAQAWLVRGAVLGVVVLAINPVVAWRVLRQARPWTLATLAVAVTLAFAAFGPPFVRYVVPLLPIAAVFGVLVILRGPNASRAVALAVVAALAATPATMSFVASGPDPTSGNDVPGGAAWDKAATATDAHLPPEIGATVPTALAHYLVSQHGYHVADASQGPRLLVVASPEGRQVEIFGVPAPDESLVQPSWVPARWMEQGLLEAPTDVCASVQGLVLVAPSSQCPLPA